MTRSKIAALVIGDVMLDREIAGGVSRISPEAPVPVVKLGTKVSSPGGAANVARNIVSLGGQAYLLGVVGDDPAGKELTECVGNQGVTTCLPVKPGAVTVQKTRITSGGQTLLRIDEERPAALANDDALLAGLREVLGYGEIKVIVISDYGKGTVTQAIVDFVMEYSLQARIPVFVDCRPAQLSLYAGQKISMLKPNFREAMGMLDLLGDVHPALAIADTHLRADVIVSRLRTHTGAGTVFLTMGGDGCAYYDAADGRVHVFQTKVQHVYDVCGAGDTVMAALAVACMESRPISLAAAFAMYAAGLAVREHGVIAVKRDDVEECRYADVGWAAKLMDLERLYQFVDRRRRMGHRIVVTNGCFDGLHVGHVELLRWAKQRGETLVVCFNDDDSLRSLKGFTRPFIPESYRGAHLAQQESVDAVYRFNGDVEALVRMLRPDVLVKGEDSAKGPIPGAEYVASHGGVVALGPVLFDLSSSRAGGGKPVENG